MIYTVVGYYENNDQPFLGSAEAENAEDALATVVELVHEAGENAYELVVLYVLLGEHSDALGTGPLYVGDADAFAYLFVDPAGAK